MYILQCFHHDLLQSELSHKNGKVPLVTHRQYRQQYLLHMSLTCKIHIQAPRNFFFVIQRSKIAMETR